MSLEATKVGQRVMVNPMKHALPLEFLTRPLEITKVDGEGTSALVWLKGPKGVVKIDDIEERFLPSELSPAPANLEPAESPRVVEKEEPVQLADQVLNLANDYKRKYNLTDAEAAKRAGRDLLTTDDKQRAYLGHNVAREPLRTPDEKQVRAEVARVQSERGCTANEAADIILGAITASRFAERVMNLRSSGMDATTALLTASRVDPEGAAAWREAGVN